VHIEWLDGFIMYKYCNHHIFYISCKVSLVVMNSSALVCHGNFLSQFHFFFLITGV
jgi:hypothetical protein